MVNFVRGPAALKPEQHGTALEQERQGASPTSTPANWKMPTFAQQKQADMQKMVEQTNSKHQEAIGMNRKHLEGIGSEVQVSISSNEHRKCVFLAIPNVAQYSRGFPNISEYF